MPGRTKFNIEYCGECCVWMGCGAEGECRLNPPQILNAYSSHYPVVPASMPACFAGVAGSKQKPKGMVRKK